MTNTEESLDKKWNKAVLLIRQGDLDGALFLFKSLVNDGEKSAFREIGRIFEKKKNYAEARRWYFKSIEDADDLEGYLALARLNYEGKGAPKSTSTAIEYLNLIEANNNHKAFLLKARIYALERSLEESKSYYKKSYELGNIVALSELASINFKEKKYFKWFLRKLKAALCIFFIARKDSYNEFIRKGL